jgi:tRNA/rRNA methyltransferase
MDAIAPFSMPTLPNIRIILVEPAGALNVGSVARIMKNMGLTDLVLVKPECDPLGEEARLMAVRGFDILESARVVASLPDALAGCVKAIATTGRAPDTFNNLPLPLEHPRTALPWLLDAPSALIFGREDTGLTNAELNQAQRLIQIPASEVYPSLNLAQAVAICSYELATAIAPPSLDSPANSQIPTNPPLSPLVDRQALEAYYQQLEALLLDIGYLYPHTASSRMEKLRLLLNRAYPAAQEISMLRGILRQVAWALRQPPP